MNTIEIILPPLIGAAIGYITNSIAIKMLFKPYKKYTILKIKIPFTPGIIPKQRKELANNIGKMVGHSLLNKETIHNKILSENFQLTITNIIKTNINKLLNHELPSLIQLIPENLKHNFNNHYNTIKNKLKQIYINFIQSKNFEQLLHSIIEKAINNISQKQIQNLINEDQILSITKNTIMPLIKESTQSQTLHNFITNSINKIQKNPKTLNDFIPKDIIDIITEKIILQIPYIITETQNAIFRLKLDEKLYLILKDMIIEYIEKSGIFIQFFSSVLLVEEWIEENLHNFTKEFFYKGFDNLRQKENIKEISIIIYEKINKLFNIPIKELSSKINNENKNSIIQNISSKIQNYINNEKFLNNIQTLITNYFSSIKHKPIKYIIKNSEKQITNSITKNIILTLREKETIQLCTSIIETKLDETIYTKQIGKINNIITINNTETNKIAKTLSKKLISITENDLSKIIEKINLTNIVISKINNFPLQKIENILLSIMKKHLKWINIFGAILGSILGAMQVLYQITKQYL